MMRDILTVLLRGGENMKDFSHRVGDEGTRGWEFVQQKYHVHCLSYCWVGFQVRVKQEVAEVATV
jgi:hypothetical protein